MRLVAAVLLLTCVLPLSVTAQPAIAFTNGRWFNGSEFEPRVMYSVTGLLQSQRPATVDSSVDLQGGYIVPPLAKRITTMSRGPHAPTLRSRAICRRGFSMS